MASNWDPNQVPSTADIAVLTNNGTYTVTLNADPILSGLILGGTVGTQSLVTAGRVLTINGASAVGPQGRLVLSGWVLTGTHELSLAGAIDWVYGAIDTNVAVTVASGGVVSIASAANYTKHLYGSLTNNGTVLWQPLGSLAIGGTLHNRAGGLLDAQVAGTLVQSGPDALLVNEGTLRKSISTGILSCQVPIINRGVVDTQTGVLRLGDGSVLQTGSAFTGPGRTQCDAGTNTLNGTIESENLALSGAAWAGTGHLGGAVRWSAGTILSGAAVTVAPDGLLTISSEANYVKVLSGSLTNEGTILWQPYGALSISGTLHNRAGALFDAQVALTLTKSGPDALFINEGTLRKSVEPGSLVIQVPLINRGVVDTQTGALTLGDGSVFQEGCSFTGLGVTQCDGGTNTLDGSFHSENLALNGAGWAGAGRLSGAVRWSAGTILPGAAVTVASDGLLTISSGANYVKALSGSLTNEGTILWQPHGGLSISGTLHNRPGALFDAQVTGTLSKSGPNALFINEGTLRKSVSAAGLACLVPVVNWGVVDTQAGVLTLADGSVFHGGCGFTGLGVTRLDAGTNTVSGSFNSENLELSGATLVGQGAVNGSFTWSAGTIDAGFSFNITATGQLNISSSANYTKVLNGCLTNAGTVVWRPFGELLLGGIVHNLPGGLFEIRTDRFLGSNAPAAVILNDGVLRKTGSIGSTWCTAQLINNGVVEIESGALEVRGGYVQPVGTLRLAGGAFRSPEPLLLGGGHLTGWGEVQTSVTNTGRVAPASSNGLLWIRGNYTQPLGGTLELALGGTEPGTNQSLLRISGRARLSGSIGVRWAEGYLPEPGTTFDVLTFDSRVGRFACQNGFILLGQGRRLLPTYTPATVMLVMTAAPEPVEVPLRVTVEEAALVCWPTEFPGYDLYSSADLDPPEWTLLPGVTNAFIDPAPLPRHKFYQLRKALPPEIEPGSP